MDDKPSETTQVNDVSINWHEDNMESLYANIGTATANREEFFLLFGTHQNWRGKAGDNRAIDVQLSKRIVMSPYAAKRLTAVLVNSVKVYEQQFGKIEI